MGNETAILAIQDPPYNLVAFESIDPCSRPSASHHSDIRPEVDVSNATRLYGGS